MENSTKVRTCSRKIVNITYQNFLLSYWRLTFQKLIPSNGSLYKGTPNPVPFLFCDVIAEKAHIVWYGLAPSLVKLCYKKVNKYKQKIRILNLRDQNVGIKFAIVWLQGRLAPWFHCSFVLWSLLKFKILNFCLYL